MTPEQRQQFDRFGCVPRCIIELSNERGPPITDDEFCRQFDYLFLTPGEYGNLIDSQIVEVIRVLDLGHDFHILRRYDAIVWEFGHEHRDVLVLSEIDLRENEATPIKHCSLLREIDRDHFRMWIPWNNAPGSERDFAAIAWTLIAPCLPRL